MTQPTPPVKRKSKLPLILTGLIVLLCCGGGTALLASNMANKTPTIPGGKQIQQPSSTKTTAAAAPAAKPTYGTPKPADFVLIVKELDKQCFGSAGCNLQFRISKVNYSGPKLDPSATYEVSYAYKGLEDPMSGTFELAGDGSYSVDETEYGQTKRSSAKVSAVVTAVELM